MMYYTIVYGIVSLSLINSSIAFNTLRSPILKRSYHYSTPEEKTTESEQAKKKEYDDGNLLNGLKAGFSILRKGIVKGDGFKQSLADALAGPDLDLEVANDRIDTYIASAPVVIFSWTVSVFSKKAKKYLNSIGVKYEAIELDQPWSDGNPIRSALGRRVGRTSVPAIFINGKYIGGCEDGPFPEAPGLIPLAFQGKLRPMLIAAGALQADESLDVKSDTKHVVETSTLDDPSSVSPVFHEKKNEHDEKSSTEHGENAVFTSYFKVRTNGDSVVSDAVSKNQKLSTPSTSSNISGAIIGNIVSNTGNSASSKRSAFSAENIVVSSIVTTNQQKAINNVKDLNDARDINNIVPPPTSTQPVVGGIVESLVVGTVPTVGGLVKEIRKGVVEGIVEGVVGGVEEVVEKIGGIQGDIKSESNMNKDQPKAKGKGNGFYNKDDNIDDENCPLEEDCEL